MAPGAPLTDRLGHPCRRVSSGADTFAGGQEDIAMRRSLALALLLGATLVVGVPGGALAGEQPDPDLSDTVLGTVDGVRYARESAPFDGGSGYGWALAGCGGPRWHLIGGGASATGPAADTWQAVLTVRDHTDADEVPDDGFEADAFGTPGHKVTAWSICIRDTAMKHITTAVPSQPSPLRSGSASCGAARWHAVSGGVFIATSDSWVGSSYPIDGGDPDATADDGWQGRAFDTVGGAGGFYVSMVCASGVSLHYVNGPGGEVAVGAAITRKATCGAGEHVVGGGVRIGGLVDTGRMIASAPFDGPDADTIPDDGWKARVHNTGDGSKLVAAYAVCLR